MRVRVERYDEVGQEFTVSYITVDEHNNLQLWRQGQKLTPFKVVNAGSWTSWEQISA